jgi:two-component system response regulator HydG
MSTPEPKPRVLVVDDKREFAETVADGLADHGYRATALNSAHAALALLEKEDFDALVTDLRMPDLDGLELVARARVLSAERPVIVMTAYGAIDTAVESIRRGAYHYLTKPFKAEELLLFLGRALEDVRLRREAAALKSSLGDRLSGAGILGKSKAIREARDLVDRVSRTDVPVLITGETGTGKGLWAQAIHWGGSRSGAPFVTLNCAALPEPLQESELFGHLKGAFTGANETRPGLFTEANGGTLFLDEIGEMGAGLQAKLLRVLEAGMVRPVGASKEHPVDVRIIAATHRDLRQRAQDGTFRSDLLYRLDVVAFELPALRHRREDIPELALHFLERARKKYPDSPVQGISGEVMALLLEHPWPGNVRELAHTLERMVVLGKSPQASREDLPPSFTSPAGAPKAMFEGVMPIRELQRRYAAWALEQLGGHKGRTAERLDVDAKTLAKWLARDPD